jgi:dolichyl-phosphate beta-glucosyltransferase
MMTESDRGDVSIVIPAFAEAARIGRAVRAVRGWGNAFPRWRELIVVVEPSGDETAEVARQAAEGDARVRVIENPVHRGKGFAVRTGMLAAAGELIFFMDADLSVPLSYIVPFVEHLDAHPETAVAIGNRRHPLSQVTKRQQMWREKAGRGFNHVLRGLGLHQSLDTQCGFKAFRRSAAREVFRRATVDGFAFDAEVLVLAREMGWLVDDLPVEWINDPETKFRPLRDGWRSLADLWRIRRLYGTGGSGER